MRVKFESTGEVRPPRKDEWFWGFGGYCLQASADISEPFPILRMTICEEEQEPQVRLAGNKTDAA
ncbi:MAG: hypothetical protein HZA60_07420 [Deltaproteobacteria bacterium]|nr:hypothetical protein [Deltaproteobacteria bacterium]